MSSQQQRRILVIASTLFLMAACGYSAQAVFFPAPLTKEPLAVDPNPLTPVANPNRIEQIRPAVEDFEKVWQVRLQANRKTAKPAAPVVKKKEARPKATVVLQGIFHQAGKEADSFAILTTKGRQQGLLRKVGQSIGDQGPVLTAIYIDHVEVKYNDGTIDRLTLPKPK